MCWPKDFHVPVTLAIGGQPCRGQKERPPVARRPFRFETASANYMWFAVVVFVVVVVVVLELPAVPDVTVLLVVLLVAGIGAFMSGAMVSLVIMVPLSTTTALAELLAALPPQAETRRAAPAIVAMERMLRMKRSP
jgi:hypothetical protein